MSTPPITVETVVNADIDKVWQYWNQPDHIKQWYFASDDWEAPAADNDVKVGGQLFITMSAKDKSAGFDLTGVYSVVEDKQRLEFDFPDHRHIVVEFIQEPDGVKIIETFDPEQENPDDFQRAGWQAILDNFKKHVESN